jgi:hypothetical protein
MIKINICVLSRDCYPKTYVRQAKAAFLISSNFGVDRDNLKSQNTQLLIDFVNDLIKLEA